MLQGDAYLERPSYTDSTRLKFYHGFAQEAFLRHLYDLFRAFINKAPKLKLG